MTKLGIQISSLKDYLQTPEDVVATFKKVSDIGYERIQIQWVNPEISHEVIHGALQEANLQCLGTQESYDNVTENLASFIDRNTLWGGKYVTLSGIPEKYHSHEGCLAFAAELNELSLTCEKYGRILNFHPRAKDVFYYESTNSLEVIFDNTRPEMQFLLDIYQIVAAELDPVAWIEKVEGRNDVIHFKDGIISSDEEPVLTPIGQGEIDWEPIIEATIKTGVKYALAEQESFGSEPFQCLKDSYDYLVARGIE
ncbi:TIM barrel protein [Aerococcaceae bacterium DSM 111176]|nr:TIM barrel protein [Aerococcaceae bacterium DSM 111176]